MHNDHEPFLRKQAWDYFTTHAAQRMSTFNFYIVLSSLTATTYAASWKDDSSLQSARALLAFLLCLFSFVFWKLDQRNKALIKNAERALKYYESLDVGEIITKVFTQEEIETDRRMAGVRGWRRLQIWDWTLSYSHCFSSIFATFAIVGALGLIQAAYHNIDLARWLSAIRRLL